MIAFLISLVLVVALAGVGFASGWSRRGEPVDREQERRDEAAGVAASIFSSTGGQMSGARDGSGARDLGQGDLDQGADLAP